MSEKIADITGQILSFAIFVTPFITIPIVRRIFKVQRFLSVLIGLVFAFLISYFLYQVSLGLFVRDAFGATVTSTSYTIANAEDSVVRIEMDLSAFGVESDSFPSIKVAIDFKNDTSVCEKSYYNPAYKGSKYSLTKNELIQIRHLLKISDLEKLKTEYKMSRPDQPTSTTKIFTTKKTFVITDYGLEGDDPLKQLYEMVYRL